MIKIPLRLQIPQSSFQSNSAPKDNGANISRKEGSHEYRRVCPASTHFQAVNYITQWENVTARPLSSLVFYPPHNISHVMRLNPSVQGVKWTGRYLPVTSQTFHEADKLHILTGSKDSRERWKDQAEGKDSQAHDSHKDISSPGAHKSNYELGIITLK